MSVEVHITHDPTTPAHCPRIEKIANLDAAAITAMRLGWSCRITVPPAPLDGRPQERFFTFEQGRLVEGDVDDGTRAWWAMRAADLHGPAPGKEYSVQEWLDLAATGRLGCLLGAPTVGRCGKPVLPGTTRCADHPARDAFPKEGSPVSEDQTIPTEVVSTEVVHPAPDDELP